MRIDVDDNHIAAIIEGILQKGRDEIVGSAAHYLADIENEPKILLTTNWLLMETLVRLIKEGGESRFYVVADDASNVFACAMLHPTSENVETLTARLREFVARHEKFASLRR